MLAASSYFGLAALERKKNVVLRGGLPGAAAGLTSTFLADDTPKVGNENMDGSSTSFSDKDDVTQTILTIAIYTAGGMLAGTALKKIVKKTLKKLKRGVQKKD